jgi:hypothetical protein
VPHAIESVSILLKAPLTPVYLPKVWKKKDWVVVYAMALEAYTWKMNMNRISSSIRPRIQRYVSVVTWIKKRNSGCNTTIPYSKD